MSTLAIVAVEPGRVARGIALALMAYAAFSTADALMKFSSAGFSVFQVAFVMAFFAMLPVLATTIGRGGLESVLPRNVKLVALRGMLAAGCGTLVWNAFALLPMAEVYALLFAAPMLVTAFSAVLLGETVGWRRWSATVAGFAGVVIMIDPRFSAGLGFGHLMAAMGAVCGALSFVILKKIGATEKSAAMLFSVLFWLLAVSLPAAVANWVWPDPGELGLMAVAGLLMGLGQAGLVFATRDAPAVVVAPFQYSQMIWAVAFGLLVFGDVPTLELFIGLAVVIAAGLFIIYRETVRSKPVTVGSGRGEVSARIARL